MIESWPHMASMLEPIGLRADVLSWGSAQVFEFSADDKQTKMIRPNDPLWDNWKQAGATLALILLMRRLAGIA